MDTDSISAIDGTCHVVATIYIIYMSSIYQYTGRQLAGEVIAIQVRTRTVFAVHRRHHVGHSAATIEVIDDEGGIVLDLQEQTFGTGHVALVATAVEVTYLTCQEVPRRTDVHRCRIVSTKEAAYLVGTAAGLREGGVDAHLYEALVREQFFKVRGGRIFFLIGQIGLIVLIGISISLFTGCFVDQYMVHHRTGVIHVYDVLFLHGSVVTTAVGIDDGAAHHFHIGLVELRQMEACATLIGHDLCHWFAVVAAVVDAMCHLALCWTGYLFVVIVTIAAGKELAYIHLLGIRIRLNVSSTLSVSRILRVCRCVSDFFWSIMLISGQCADAHKAVECIVNDVLRRVFLVGRGALDSCQFVRHNPRTYMTCDVVATEHLIDNDIVGNGSVIFGEVLSIDVYEGTSAHIGHTGTAEHLTLLVRKGSGGLRVKSGTYVASQHGDIRAALHLTHVATAIDVATNLDLRYAK